MITKRFDLVKVSRRLDQREVHIWVTDAEVAGTISVPDFISEMVKIAGGGMYTKAKLEATLHRAALEVQAQLQKDIAEQL